MDAFVLSRIQIGALTYFHLLFPAVTMTLGWVLLTFRLRAFGAGGSVWLHAYRFWLPVFALSLALGVVSGAALLFQTDLSFPQFTELSGSVFSLVVWLAGAGVILQAAGLGVAFLAPGRVSEYAETCAVAVAATGATLMAFGPVILAGWMRSPGAATSGLPSVILNLDIVILTVQLMLASAVVTGLLLTGLSAGRRLIQDHAENTRVALKFGLQLSVMASALAVVFFVARFGLGSGQPIAQLLQLSYTVVLLSSVLFWLRADGLTPLALLGLVVSPLGGWILILLGWYSGGAVQSGWLKAGALRMDQALAVTRPGTVEATLPLYLVTIVILLGAYWVVLAMMARNAARASRPRFSRSVSGLQLPTLHPNTAPLR